jgi:hypothetical protein
MTISKDDKLIGDIRYYLDKSIEDLPGDVLKKLQSARRQAVTVVQSSEHSDYSAATIALAARTSLDDTSEALDPEIQRRLDMIRTQAVERMKVSATSRQATKPTLWQKIQQLIHHHEFGFQAGALVTACVLVTVVALQLQFPESGTVNPTDSDILLFASADEIELYENLEFYLWLAENGIPE